MVKSPDEIRIWKLFKYIQDEFNAAGIRIEFPKNTVPSRTYKWRYLENFRDKIDELQIPNQVVLELVKAVVNYACKNGQLRKGLALFSSDVILEAALKSVSKERKSIDWLIAVMERDRKTLLDCNLLGRSSTNGLPNIVKLYMMGKISVVYLALSRKCHDAMMQLDKVERSMMPGGKQLALTRIDVFYNPRTKNRIRQIMLDDWRTDVS